MPKLIVRNNWEALEWAFDGKRIAPERVFEVQIGHTWCKARPARRVRSYNDHGHRHTVETTDIEVEIAVLLVPEKLWLSLAHFEELRSGVTHLRMG